MKKQLFRLLSLTWMVLAVSSLVFVASCDSDDDDDTPAAAPLATYQFEVDADNSLTVHFTNYSTNATSYAWDFGDNAGTSTDKDPSYTYADGGTYSVTLTATGAGGSADHSKDVTVIKPGGSDLIQNGGFDDESNWTILYHNDQSTGTLEIAGGVATYNKGQTGDWDTGANHIGMYQPVEVSAGSFMLDLHITTNGINEVWFEVWVGPNAPVDGADYNEDNGASRVLSFNAWACGDINNTYSGQMAEADCEGTGGLIDLETGTYYVVIRSGGVTHGDDGIIIDNVTMVGI